MELTRADQTTRYACLWLYLLRVTRSEPDRRHKRLTRFSIWKAQREHCRSCGRRIAYGEGELVRKRPCGTSGAAPINNLAVVCGGCAEARPRTAGIDGRLSAAARACTRAAGHGRRLLAPDDCGGLGRRVTA